MVATGDGRGGQSALCKQLAYTGMHFRRRVAGGLEYGAIQRRVVCHVFLMSTANLVQMHNVFSDGVFLLGYEGLSLFVVNGLRGPSS
jgi:hypothetical protein